MEKNLGKKKCKSFFYVDHNAIETSDILDTHRYLMKKTWHKIFFGFKKCLLDH